MTTSIDFTLDIKNYDFESLQNAAVRPDNKKQVIIDFLKANGIPGHGPDLKLFQNNGTVIKDDFASYLSNADFFSTGPFAKLANGTPLDFQYETTDGLKAEIEKYKDRSHFDLGSFVHEAILEPEKWDTVVCEPKANRASHEGLDTLIDFWSIFIEGGRIDTSSMKTDMKKAYISELIEKSGKRAIDFKDALIVQRLHERWRAYQNGLWAGILDAAHKEVSIYCNDYMGLPMRVRPDGLLFAEQIGVNAIVSVKTTAEKSVNGYARQCRQFGYDIKESAYQKIVSQVTGLDFSTTIMIVLSTAEPFHIGVFILNDGEMEAASKSFATAVDHAKHCIAMNSYPGWEIKAEVGDMGLIDLNLYNS
ncbi:MAG: PD-(D/E)XK nuclease-like domain-containing protein [Saprospiraceae bacterium]|nr:PD-(D/E)XK nuclease-like domain-containing protein [Saprospiraceae bacterium]